MVESSMNSASAIATKDQASVERQNGVRPARHAILREPVPGVRHKVGPIRCTEVVAVRLHQASGIDPADSVKRFRKNQESRYGKYISMAGS